MALATYTIHPDPEEVQENAVVVAVATTVTWCCTMKFVSTFDTFTPFESSNDWLKYIFFLIRDRQVLSRRGSRGWALGRAPIRAPIQASAHKRFKVAYSGAACRGERRRHVVPHPVQPQCTWLPLRTDHVQGRGFGKRNPCVAGWLAPAASCSDGAWEAVVPI